jgi:SAM-dependent methyltransferase
MDLVSQQYWDDSYKDFNYYVAKDEVTAWLDEQKHLFPVKGSLFEFGCYPGRYLSFLGKRGWMVNGIDLTAAITEPRFTTWLQQEGIATGTLNQGDALSYARSTTDRYDLVCSFGFIEHFENFLNVIELHDQILKPGGSLIITTPNFRGGIQRFLHTKFNEKALGIHYLPSMQPDVWKKKLEELGYVVKIAGYFGGFDFWCDEAKRSDIQNFILKLICKVKPFVKGFPNRAAYSPYCGIIAQKFVK